MKTFLKIATALITILAIVWFNLPNRKTFVVNDISKPQTFTYRRYAILPSSGISLNVKGEIKGRAINIKLRPCGGKWVEHPAIGERQFTGKFDESIGNDFFSNQVCIDYIPVKAPEGNVELTVQIP